MAKEEFDINKWLKLSESLRDAGKEADLFSGNIKSLSEAVGSWKSMTTDGVNPFGGLYSSGSSLLSGKPFSPDGMEDVIRQIKESIATRIKEPLASSLTDASALPETSGTGSGKDADNQFAELQTKYQAHVDKLLKIEADYQEKLKEIQAQPDSGEKERESRILEELKNKALKDANAELQREISNTEFFLTTFTEAAKLSAVEMYKLLNETEKFYDYLKNTDKEDLKAGFGYNAEELGLIKENDALMETIAKAVEGKQKVLEAKNELLSWVQEIESGAKNVFSLDIEDITKGIGQINSALGKMKKSAESVGKDVGTIISGFSSKGAEKYNDKFSGLMDNVGVVTGLLDSTMKVGGGVAKIMSGDIFGGVTDAISGVANVFSMANAASERHREALKKVAKEEEAVVKKIEEAQRKKNLTLEDETSIFGTKKMAQLRSAMEEYAKAYAKYEEKLKGKAPDYDKIAALEEKLESGEGSSLSQFFNKKKLNSLQKYAKAYEEGVAGLNKLEIVTGHKKTGLFGWGKGKDTYSGILEVYPELNKGAGELDMELLKIIRDTRSMTDETKAYIDELIELNNQAEEAQKVLDDYLKSTFGSLGSSVMSAITTAITTEGINAWEKFGAAGSDIIAKLGSELAYELYMADKFAQLEKDLGDIFKQDYSSEELAKQQMNVLSDFYETIQDNMNDAQKFMEDWQQLAAEKGFEIWGGTKAEATAKGIAAMSQESATELNGNFYALRQSTGEIRNISEENRMAFAGINTNTGRLVEVSSQSMDIFREQLNTQGKIEQNTYQMYRVLEEMQTSGVKVKV